MSTTRSSVGNPFLVRAPTDPDAAAQHRPPIDDETMQRLRSPFQTGPFDAPKRRVVVFDEDDPRGEQDRLPHGQGKG